MTDSIFQWSLTALTVVVLILIIAGSILRVLSIPVVILLGIIVWAVIGGTLLHRWGKDYMSRK